MADIKKVADPKKAKILMRFFKTGKGEYGEGDVFWGIVVPKQRIIAKKHRAISLEECLSLLKSRIHECRLTALFILIDKYKKGSFEIKERIFQEYLKNTEYINNWDLVDLSAPNIIGDYLYDKDKSILSKFVKSKSLWERRIAILATFSFIRQNKFTDSLSLAEELLNDKEDLIHKAVGWMLREIGKRNLKVEEDFLRRYYRVMPRTMLRYAIEKFSEEKRKFYLKKS